VECAAGCAARSEVVGTRSVALHTCHGRGELKCLAVRRRNLQRDIE
jgi:hypothetical protein